MSEKQIADCTKCRTPCRNREWFENEMWVKEHGCRWFTPAKENEEGSR